MIRTYKHITAQIDAGAETRTEVLLGREYLVVPVIAMVQGVRHGANSDGNGELGLVTEFGKHPVSWNSKPVVLNHPEVNGDFVSANTPTVLESYYLGAIHRTEVVGSKLRMEAWLDPSVETRELATQAMFNRIRDGETVEVSVGMFVDLEEVDGTFEGESYGAIWHNIVPDHLALLESGIEGACSIADGCGTHRNQTKDQQGDSIMPKMRVDKSAESCAVNAEGGCGCGGACDKSAVQPQETGESLTQLKRVLSALRVEGAPADMLSNDVYTVLSTALNATQSSYAYVVGFTAENVVFETYSSVLDRWAVFQQNYSIDDDGTVTFPSDSIEVRLLTKVVSVAEADGGEPINVNTTDEEAIVAENTNEETGSVEPEVEANVDSVEGSEASIETPVAQAAPAAPVVQSVQEYIAAAPEAMREVLNQGHKVLQAQKAAAITALKGTGRCKFSDDVLNSMDIDGLTNLQELANVPSYEGRVAPTAQTSADDGAVPPAPKLFQKKD